MQNMCKPLSWIAARLHGTVPVKLDSDLTADAASQLLTTAGPWVRFDVISWLGI